MFYPFANGTAQPHVRRAPSANEKRLRSAIARTFWDTVLNAWCKRVEDQDWAAFSLQHAHAHTRLASNFASLSVNRSLVHR